MSKNFRDRLDSWARRAHVNYFGEHLSYDERGALDNVDTPLDASNPPVTKDDLATSTVTSFNGRVGAVTPEVADYNASDIDNDSSVSGSKVDDALDELQTEVETNATDIATLSAATYPDTMVQAVGVEMNYRSNVLDDSGTYYANEGANEISTLMTNALYKKVNLLLTPSGTKAGTGAGDGTLFSIKGDDFTVARNAIKSYVDVDGYIRFVAVDEATIDYSDGAASINLEPQSTNKYLYPFAAEHSYSTKTGLSVELDASTAGSELVTNGDFSAWTSDNPDNWSVPTEDANNYVTEDAAGAKLVSDGSLMYLSQGPLTSGNLYMVTVDIEAISGAGVKIENGGVAIKYLSSTGSVTFYFRATSPSFYISRSGATETIIKSVSFKEVQPFASPFKDSSGNIELVARKLVEDGSIGEHKILKSMASLTDAGTYALSEIFKYNGRNVKVNIEDGTNVATATFDLENGTVLSGSGTIDELADGYYKLAVTDTFPAGNTTADVVAYLVDASENDSYTGDGTSGVYIAGIQFEEQAAATSFINDPSVAEGSEVTRLGDEVSGATFSGNSESGTILVEIAALSNDLTSRAIFIHDGTINNYIQIRYYVGSNGIAISLYNGSYQISQGITITDITTFHKIAFRYKLNDFSIYIDGELKYTDTTGTTFPAGTLKYVSFKSSSDADKFYGKVKQLYTTSYLTDAEMATLTQ